MSIRNLNSNSLHIIAIAALAVIVMATYAFAAGATVSNAWMRALPAGLPAGGYFELHNGSDHTISLTGASSPACGMLMLHKSVTTGGMARMEDVEQVDVPAGDTARFAPGGYHLMCMSPKPEMKPGGHVPVTLTFADGKKLQAEFSVRGAAGK